MSDLKALAAYRQFATDVAERLTYAFTVDGYPRGTGKETRAVLRAIREDLRILRHAVEFPAPDGSAEPTEIDPAATP